LVAGDTFTLDLIDKAKELAITATPQIRPVKIKGKLANAGTAAQTSTTRWRTCTSSTCTRIRSRRCAATPRPASGSTCRRPPSQGREETGNKIFSGAIGMYNGVIMRSAIDVTDGVSAAGADVSTVRRAVLLGGQAAMMGFGRDNGPNKITWNEELFDHKRRLEISALTIHGSKRPGTTASTTARW
jgi:hypothetical protein